MKAQEKLNFDRVARAIEYIGDHFREQPSLDEIARSVHLSPHHFQRMFTEWAGTSPKKFLQYVSISYAKKVLREDQATLFDTSFRTGLSGSGRLHDLFVTIEGMTPAEYKQGGKALSINYGFFNTSFGNIIVASTDKGICHLGFYDAEEEALDTLISNFPKARFQQESDIFQEQAVSIFSRDWKNIDQIKLYLKGSPFQLKVWEALLKIPLGQLTTYGSIARNLDHPNASRAVGSAVGANPVAYLIPCHRVIRSTGKMDGYMWGNSRKKAIIGWEAVQINS